MDDIIKRVYCKLLANDMVSTSLSEGNNSETEGKFFHISNETKKTVYEPMQITQDDIKLLQIFYKNDAKFGNARKFKEDGVIYLDDGGILCGRIFRLNNDGTITPCGIK